MVAFSANPFERAYATESVDDDQFVVLFSPILIEYAPQLFVDDNVVVKGIQGAGKTMLLALFRPSVRIAYGRAGRDFPVLPQHSDYIGAGFSVRRSGSIDFGQLDWASEAQMGRCFGDYLNHSLLEDLIHSVLCLSEAAESGLVTGLSIERNQRALDEWARQLACERCWNDAFNGVGTLQELQEVVKRRRGLYRNALETARMDVIDDAMLKTVSDVGEPISIAADLLREMNVIGPETKVLLRFDEYDQLTHVRQLPAEAGRVMQSVVNKALGRRDRRALYRIGTRPYSWRSGALPVFGTQEMLQEDRDYMVFDFDKVLGSTEHRDGPVFRNLACDVFRRRLIHAGLLDEAANPVDVCEPFNRFFGRSPTAEQKSLRHVGRTSQSRGLGDISDLSTDWQAFLRRLAEVHPLQARVGAAWVRCGRAEGAPPPAQGTGTPWGGNQDAWWANARYSQALIQIAAEAKDRLVWAGCEDVLKLSGDHILAFLGICRYVWSAWNRSADASSVVAWTDITEVDLNLQTIGIDDSSEAEYRKLLDMPHGDTRRNAATAMAQTLRRMLKEDKRLSYPGRSGFTLDLSALDRNEYADVRCFLDNMVDYGVLRRRDNKGLNGQMRARFHVAPWLAPYFQLPMDNGQEPFAPSLQVIVAWSQGHEISLRNATASPGQMPLFDEDVAE